MSITPGSSTNLVIGLTVFGVALVVAGVWLFLRSRKTGVDETALEDETTEEAEITTDNPDALMDAIIALDDLYQAGDLPESAYQERRAKLKRRLQEVSGEGG